MNNYRTVVSILAMAALSAPVVCQAQDPATAYKQVMALAAQGKAQEAIAVCDTVIAQYGNPANRVAKQFAHMVPYFLWQKGTLASGIKDYNAAYEAFKTLNENPMYREQTYRARAKRISKTNPEGYDPFLSMSLFQMGYMRFQQAVGTEQAPGDPALFAEAIPPLKEYLEKYMSGAVSPAEKDLKLDGKICFILLQAYLLQPEPDFENAGKYLEMSRKAKAALPDDMAMNGLSTVIKVASKNPAQIDWCNKVISSNPESFNVGAARLAPYGASFLNHGIKAAGMIETAIRGNDMETAAAAYRSAIALFSLVPDSNVAVTEMEPTSSAKFKGPIPDPALGVTFVPAARAKLRATYGNFIKKNSELDAYAIMVSGSAAQQMGATRLTKAAFGTLVERYPGLKKKQGDKYVAMKDTNVFTYAQLCRQTGDNATAEALEKTVDAEKLGGGGKVGVLVNTMARLLKEQKWSEVIPAAEDVMRELSATPGDPKYVSAQFAIIAAHYKLGQYTDVITKGMALLDGGTLVPGEGKGALTAKNVTTYKSQCSFFVIDSYLRTAASDPANYAKCLERVEVFIADFPSMDLKENPLIINAYYSAVDALLKRQGNGDAEAQKADMAKALEYCNIITDNWKDHALYPIVRLLAGNLLIQGDDDSKKPEGIIALEETAEAALAQEGGKGQNVAANALYWLASYAPEIPRQGEDAKAKAARIQGYVDRFWAEADKEGNAFALQMASLGLSRAADSKDQATFDAAVTRAREVIIREANYNYGAKKIDPELERTINSFMADYARGKEACGGKPMTMDDHKALVASFSGLESEDKYTQSIFRMSTLNAMFEQRTLLKQAATKAKQASKADEAKALEDQAADIDVEIDSEFTRMTAEFKPDVLSNYVCVRLGDHLVDYAAGLPDKTARSEKIQQAVSYFDKVLERQSDMMGDAKTGKARSLMVGEDYAGAEAIFRELAGSGDFKVAASANYYLVELLTKSKKYAEAIEIGVKYLENRGAPKRLDMLMMLGNAYYQNNEKDKALESYRNIYNQHRGNIAYSAPACKAMIELLWERNNASSGDRLKGDYAPSDRWLAWSLADTYVGQVEKAKLEQKMSPSERDKFNEVRALYRKYAADAAVQREDKESKAFAARIKK